tara:strand:+ start:4689 stop:6071 length:1383 start_codon:yes stop_codon:yes gene_type:complete
LIVQSETFQKTIKDKINFEGVGLHTGLYCKLILNPAPVDYGVKFLINNTEISANIENVVNTIRGTNLLKNGNSVMTVEHLLSALYALEIDNVKIEISEIEIPILDGTSQIFLKKIIDIGIQEQNKKRKEFIVNELISFKSSKGIQFYLLPSQESIFTYHLNYQNIDMLNQQFSVILKDDNYQKEVSFCKTFCLLSELLKLYNADLIKGGSLKNAVVYIDKEINDTELKQIKKIFNMDIKIDYSSPILSNVDNATENEAAKHKLLDLIGDTALLGLRIKGHLIANKSGHESNVEFVNYLKNNYLNSKLNIERKGENMYDIGQILDIMPHRYPFLLVDKILHLEPNKSVSAIKNVTINEPFFLGHFPDKPVMPGVLLLESMAQTGGFLVLHSIDEPNKKLIYLSSIKSAKFKEVVQPGDQLLIKAKLDKFKMGTCKIVSSIYVNNKLITECELLASIVNRYE